VTAETSKKIDYFKSNFQRKFIEGDEIKALSKVSLDFLKFLKDRMDVTQISRYQVTNNIFGGNVAKPLNLDLLQKLETYKEFLDGLDKTLPELGGLKGVMDRLYHPGLEGTFGNNMATFLLRLAEQGGNDYINLFKSLNKGNEAHKADFGKDKQLTFSDLTLLSYLGEENSMEFLKNNAEFLQYLNKQIDHPNGWKRVAMGGMNYHRKNTRTISGSGKSIMRMFNGLIDNGGQVLCEKYRHSINQGEKLSPMDVLLLSATSYYDPKFIDGLTNNQNTVLSETEKNYLLIVAQDKRLSQFVTKNEAARYVVFEQKTLEWMLKNSDKIDKNILQEIYKDHGKVSVFDMSLVNALSVDSKLLSFYKNRSELESFARGLYKNEDPVIRSIYGYRKVKAEERPKIESLSSFDILKKKVFYESLQRPDVKNFLGTLIWKDINEYKKGTKGDEFESELGFDAYYENGRLAFVPIPPSPFVPRGSLGGGIIIFGSTTNGEFMRVHEPKERNGYMPLIIGHLHATTEDDSAYSAASGLQYAQEYGKFGGDMASALLNFSNEAVITTRGVDGKQMKVNADYYRVGTKDRKRFPIAVDIAREVLPYAKILEINLNHNNPTK